MPKVFHPKLLRFIGLFYLCSFGALTTQAQAVSESFDTQIACDYYTWIDGNTYTENNNTATYSLTNSTGEDSTIKLNLFILKSTSSVDVQKRIDTYTWIDGIIYRASNNNATYTLTNAAGCDSVITLNLSLTYTTINVDKQIICNSYTWIDGITYTDNNNTASYTLVDVNGLDSIVNLDLTILKPTGIDKQIANETYTWIDGITYTVSNNTATQVLTSTTGCDSVVTLNLTINHPVSLNEYPCAYVMLASKQIKFKDTHLISGGIGIFGSDGNIIINESILRADAFIKTEFLDFELLREDSQVIRATAPSPYPFEGNVFKDKLKKRVSISNTEVITENHFKKLTVETYANITFSGNADIYIKKLKMKFGSSLSISGDAKIHLQRKPRFARDIKINKRKENLQFYSNRKVIFKKHSLINANFHSRKKIKVINSTNESPTKITGLFVGTAINIGENVRWDGSLIKCNELDTDSSAIVNNLASSHLETLPSSARLSGESGLNQRNTPLVVEKEVKHIGYGPNPTSGEVNLFFPRAEKGEATIQIYDISGKLYFQTKKEIQPRVSLNLNTLNNGNYLLKVKTTRTEELIRVLIE